MENRHSTTNELIDALYGVGDTHTQECEGCAARLEELRERRRESWTDAAFSDAELADQARKWRERVQGERSAWPGWRWRIAVATAALAALTIAILPRKAPPPVDDARLFEDAFRKAMTVEPASFAPMEGLFERSQQ